jgi:hypothetical protein
MFLPAVGSASDAGGDSAIRLLRLVAGCVLPSRAGQESGVTVCCICRVRVETATCRTSTVTVNLIGGGQHKGVI